MRHHGGVLGPRRRGPALVLVRNGARFAAQPLPGPHAAAHRNQHDERPAAEGRGGKCLGSSCDLSVCPRESVLTLKRYIKWSSFLRFKRLTVV